MTGRFWKSALLTLWAIALVLTLARLAAWTGLGGTPWIGYWDMDFGPAAPYVLAAFDPRPGGAAAKAGIREGDRFDLREQSLEARRAMLNEPNLAVPLVLVAHRGSRTLSIRFAGSSAWEGASAFKVGNWVIVLISNLWFLACALLIAIRRANSPDGRMLGLILTFTVIASIGLFIPNTFLDMVSNVALSFVSGVMVSALLVRLSAQHGRRSGWRTGLEWCTYAIIAFGFFGGLASVYAEVTLRQDPLSFVYGSFWNTFNNSYNLAVAAVAVAAVATTQPSGRPRAAWLLLPLPFAFVANGIGGTIYEFVTPWFSNTGVAIVNNSILLLGAMLVTYALLSRRVLNAGFVLSRTIVVGIVSLIVVMAFVLLEWALGAVLAGASHATGLAANAALALCLGVSLQFIHKKIDEFVDAVMFRKRHADERALRDFSKEAAFVTQRDALLDQTIAMVRDHTDAHEAAIFLQDGGSYSAVREFGETRGRVDENDPAILALKTWRKPLDPHNYATQLRGDLAVPMVSRAQLLGVLLCGEHSGGEAYAPDEVEDLAVFAHGVGTALDRLDASADDSLGVVQKSLASVADGVASLGQKLDSLSNRLAGESRLREEL